MAKEDLTPWSTGQSGNPKGRPKGSKNRSTIARRWLEVEQSIKNPITGETETLSQEDIMTLAQIKKARQGDVNAYKALMDSGYGAPKNFTDVTTNGKEIQQNISILNIDPLAINEQTNDSDKED